MNLNPAEENLRRRIWGNVINLKYKCFVISNLIERYQIISKAINIFLTITSLSSVSLWLIWEKHPLLWGLIVAASNILFAIKPYLLYDRSVKILLERLPLIRDCQLKSEELWHQIMSSSKKIVDIEKSFFELYTRQTKLLDISGQFILGNYKRIRKKSIEQNKKYIMINYNIDYKDKKFVDEWILNFRAPEGDIDDEGSNPEPPPKEKGSITKS